MHVFGQLLEPLCLYAFSIEGPRYFSLFPSPPGIAQLHVLPSNTGHVLRRDYGASHRLHGIVDDIAQLLAITNAFVSLSHVFRLSALHGFGCHSSSQSSQEHVLWRSVQDALEEPRVSSTVVGADGNMMQLLVVRGAFARLQECRHRLKPAGQHGGDGGCDVDGGRGDGFGGGVSQHRGLGRRGRSGCGGGRLGRLRRLREGILIVERAAQEIVAGNENGPGDKGGSDVRDAAESSGDAGGEFGASGFQSRLEEGGGGGGAEHGGRGMRRRDCLSEDEYLRGGWE